MLTEHQEKKLQEAKEILKTNRRLLIKGSAGTGKTFLVNYLINQLPYQNNILCTAPTNKAVKVLVGKVKNPKVNFSTTHSALKLKRIINNKTGEISFKPDFSSKYPPLKDIKYIIVDEASMIPLSMLLFLEEHSHKQGCTVIFLGDNSQINPIGEDDSPVFLGIPELTDEITSYKHEGVYYQFKKQYPTVELTEIVRQKEDNPIIELSRNLSLINKRVPNFNNGKGFIYTDDYNKIIETLSYVNGTDELKYLAYTNREVDRVNKDVRERIYGKDCQMIELEETLIFDTPYKDYIANEELKVKELDVTTKDFSYMFDLKNETIRVVNLKIFSINPILQYQEEYGSLNSWNSTSSRIVKIPNVLVLHPDSVKDFGFVKDLMKARIKINAITWIEYYNFVEQFATMKYNHALSVHKSQGSTFKQVIVNIQDINTNKNQKEKERLLYTAVTRASDLLILYKT